jgi:hypothetical protein
VCKVISRTCCANKRGCLDALPPPWRFRQRRVTSTSTSSVSCTYHSSQCTHSCLPLSSLVGLKDNVRAYHVTATQSTAELRLRCTSQTPREFQQLGKSSFSQRSTTWPITVAAVFSKSNVARYTHVLLSTELFAPEPGSRIPSKAHA